MLVAIPILLAVLLWLAGVLGLKLKGPKRILSQAAIVVSAVLVGSLLFFVVSKDTSGYPINVKDKGKKDCLYRMVDQIEIEGKYFAAMEQIEFSQVPLKERSSKFFDALKGEEKIFKLPGKLTGKHPYYMIGNDQHGRRSFISYPE